MSRGAFSTWRLLIVGGLPYASPLSLSTWVVRLFTA